jgi:hypothetical protein
MRNTLENSFVERYFTPCVMAFVTFIAGCTLAANATTKKLKVSPLHDGRSLHAVQATFTLTIPEDIVQFKGISIEARGKARGKHAVLLDTYVTQGFIHSNTKVSQEYLEFTSRRHDQRLRLDISEASILQSSWIPGKTTISFLLQGDEVGLSEINDLTFTYVAKVDGEAVDPHLIEAPNYKPRGVYQGERFRPEPFFPVDLDDEQSPMALKPVTPSKNKLHQGRPENAKPDRVVRIPTRKRPSLKVEELGSDSDEDNLRRAPQDTPLRRPSKLADQ